MNYRVFQYPLPAPPELADLNAWLASRRVVSVQHHVVTQPGGAMLVFVVQSVAGDGDRDPGAGAGRARVDYRKVLDAETFARFCRLRESRKAIGAELAVPVYTLFTNEQLAAMARVHPASLAAWKEIGGLGPRRLKTHGNRLLAALASTAEPLSAS